MHLGPKLSGKGLVGSSPENSSLIVGPLFFCCLFMIDQYTGVQAPGQQAPLLGTGWCLLSCPSELTRHLSGNASGHSWLIVLGKGQ